MVEARLERKGLRQSLKLQLPQSPEDLNARLGELLANGGLRRLPNGDVFVAKRGVPGLRTLVTVVVQPAEWGSHVEITARSRLGATILGWVLGLPLIALGLLLLWFNWMSGTGLQGFMQFLVCGFVGFVLIAGAKDGAKTLIHRIEAFLFDCSPAPASEVR